MSKFKNVPYIKFIPVFVIGLIIFKIINNLGDIINWLGYLMSILSYLIWGLIIAYFLNYSIEFMIKYFRFKRILSIIVTYIIFISIMVVSIYAVFPIVKSNSTAIVENIPKFVDDLPEYLNSMKSNTIVKDFQIIEMIENNKENIIKELQVYANIILFKVVDVTTIVIKFILGILISFYMLKDKDRIQKYIKRLLYALLNKVNADKILYVGNELHVLFTKFIFGRAIVSLLVGIMCFIALSIIHAPLTPLISIIVGVTNIFPYIGPLVGGVVSTAIIFIVKPEDPILVLGCVIIFIVIQTIDGFFMGPKIVGDQVNVSPLMIIAALVIGGGFLGILGMLIAVPIIALIDRYLKVYIKGRLDEKGIDV